MSISLTMWEIWAVCCEYSGKRGPSHDRNLLSIIPSHVPHSEFWSKGPAPSLSYQFAPFQQVLALFTHMAVSINLPTDPFYLPFYTHNKNSTKTTFCYKSVRGCQIATNLCTCHDSTAVMACAKICRIYFVTMYGNKMVLRQYLNFEGRSISGMGHRSSWN